MKSDRLLERFLKYIACDSESRYEKEFCEMVEADLKLIGFTIYRDEVGPACGSNGWNIFATLPGVGEPILFSAHMDTVSPGNGIKPVIKDGVIYSSGDTILGADDKSGIAAILEAVQSTLEEGVEHRPVEVLFSVCEELGLLGAKNADYSRIKSKEAVVLDSGKNGSIVNQAPANTHLYITINGKSAHAGVAPHEGIHALKAAAKAISQIDCGFVDDFTVMNVANLLSPGKTNVVPDSATFDMEIRSFKKELLEEHIASVEKRVKAACEEFGATYKIVREDVFDALHVPEDRPILKRLLDVYEKLGVNVTVEKTYGGCDATCLFNNGIDALNVGTGMADAHSLNEHITIKDLENTTLAMKLIIRAD
ncbi:M20/M25/M40 family metallo-hydrolase [Eubacteriales bacterium OttesenSCG-928-K08]|nr:M20/M25/M40 family metallo-hydrolase [Eubacteriales bacterium OttesenSCG-928-K08]